MIVQPTRKYEQLIDELNLMLIEGHINELKLAAIRKEANNILKQDQAEGFCLLGVLAYFNNNLNESRYYHNLAIAWSDKNPNMLFNYAISLKRFGKFAEAMSLGQEAYEKTKSLKHLEFLIDTALKQGLNSIAKQYIEEKELLTGEKHPISDEEIEDNFGVVRQEIMDIVKQDIDTNYRLWKKLAHT